MILFFVVLFFFVGMEHFFVVVGVGLSMSRVRFFFVFFLVTAVESQVYYLWFLWSDFLLFLISVIFLLFLSSSLLSILLLLVCIHSCIILAGYLA